MPYIKQKDRKKFEASIKEVISLLIDPVDSVYVRGEYFGYFANRICLNFMGLENSANSFNSMFFNEGKKKILSNCADRIGAAFDKSDPIASAGELNYAISTVLWGFMGAAKGAVPANYGLRAYATGVVDKILSNITSNNIGTSQKDMSMGFRRHLIVRGVLSGVLDEYYRCIMVPYEQQKIKESDTLWRDGEMI